MKVCKKAWKKGIDKGRKLGKTETLSEVALLQLTNKLGALPQDMKDAISQADLPTLLYKKIKTLIYLKINR